MRSITPFTLQFRSCRLRAGHTMAVLARILGCTTGQIGHLEAGRRAPSPEMLECLELVYPQPPRPWATVAPVDMRNLLRARREGLTLPELEKIHGSNGPLRLRRRNTRMG
jgi:transcriptional regulator with XRE-family HTH domain